MKILFPLYRFGGGKKKKAKRNILLLARKSSLPIISLHPPKYLGADYCTIDLSTLWLWSNHDSLLLMFSFNNKNLEKITIGVLSVIKNMFQKQKTKGASFFSWFYKLKELQHFLLVVFFKSSITEGFLIRVWCYT